MQKVSVLYIAGATRSGGTLLGQILGSLPGFCYAGELQYLWAESVAENEPCACGARLSTCQLWRDVLNRVVGGPERADLPALMELQRSVARERYVPMLALFNRVPGDFARAKLPQKFGALTAALYQAIAEASGASVIIDSSRAACRPFVLARLPEIDLRVIHIVRDPRAVAFSWTRRKVQFQTPEGAKRMEQWGLVYSALHWTWNNFWSKQLRSVRSGRRGYALLRYEDMIARPAHSIARTLADLGLEPPDLAPIGGPKLRLGLTHALRTNPVRFVSGEIELNPDEEWRTAMKGQGRRLVTALTWPLLRGYGYPPWRSG